VEQSNKQGTQTIDSIKPRKEERETEKKSPDVMMIMVMMVLTKGNW
jgi:hypothetical protein